MNSRDAFFIPTQQKAFYVCPVCIWLGDETELDILSSFETNLVCCPSCQNDDVRALNNLIEENLK